MANFMEDLWTSIFTDGATPTLLIATNVTFAALDLVLLSLLFLTYSIHFVVLFVLASGLWWAINWFTKEVQLAKAEEERLQKTRRDASMKASNVDPDAAGDEMSSRDGEDTEVEAEEDRSRQAVPQKTAAQASGSAPGGLSPSDAETMRQRQQQRRSMAESTGSLSTDSEWEKVGDDG